jgi:hypothetical protein
MTMRATSEIAPHAQFRTCAATHGLTLHRIHPMSGGKVGALQSTMILDCTCGQRWLMRVTQGDVVSVDGGIVEELQRMRDGQATSPPGFAGAGARVARVSRPAR